MNFNDLSDDLKAKVKACQTSEEILELAKSEGYELSEEELAAVSGGSWNSTCDSYCYDKGYKHP